MTRRLCDRFDLLELADIRLSRSDIRRLCTRTAASTDMRTITAPTAFDTRLPRAVSLSPRRLTR